MIFMFLNEYVINYSFKIICINEVFENIQYDTFKQVFNINAIHFTIKIAGKMAY